MLPSAVHAADSQVRPVEPWPGPKGEFVFVEAESIPLTDPSWSVVDTPHAFDGPMASGMKALLGAGQGGASLRQTIAVPQAGEFRLWLCFSQSRETVLRRGPFRVAVEQGGKVVSHARSMRTKRAFDPRITPRSTVRVDSLEVALDAGPATLTLTTIGRVPDAASA